MKIAVTGGLGHIGSFLIRQLPKKFPGSEIIVIDNLSTQRYCSLFNLPKNARYHFVEADILTADLAELFKDAYAVVHLAAIVNAPSSFTNRKEVSFINFAGTKRVAEACAFGGHRLFFPSSTSVYGPGGSLSPQSPYASTKLREEKCIRGFGKKQNLSFSICRFGTICGISPGMRFHTAVNKFCWQACMQKPVTIWKTALHQKRPYLDLKEAVGIILHLIENDIFLKETYDGVTANITVFDVLEILRKYVPDFSISYVEEKIMNDFSYQISDEEIRKKGFSYRGDIEKCIRDTVKLLTI